ncbi:MAG: fused MFS/spermidine synthase [Candidatus Lambdaproteobacteria bacterium]|nr:fused MFS/spermidine synthase [Candidatus Lambdaproteobacteria bacterium]
MIVSQRLADGVYVFGTVLSAVLLFQVQPLFAKTILPQFGGASSVWTMALMLYQTILLLGYLYVHYLLKPGSKRGAIKVHLALLALGVVWLLIAPHMTTFAPPAAVAPPVGLVAVFTANVLVPYFVLTTTSPLIQLFYAREGSGRVPYHLFALSNLASLGGLLAYPALIEPLLVVERQWLTWRIGFAAYALVMAAVCMRALGLRVPRAPARSLGGAGGRGWGQAGMWVFLAVPPSILLSAISSYVTHNIAPIPLLWVIPLSLYLLTFFFTFSRRSWYRRWLFIPLLFAGLAGLAAVRYHELELDHIGTALALSMGVLFAAGMVCHGELARLQPEPSRLTGYFLAIAIGGALGGTFTAVVAPLIFTDYFELEAGMVGVLLAVALALKPWAQTRAWTPVAAGQWRPLAGRGRYSAAGGGRLMAALRHWRPAATGTRLRAAGRRWLSAAARPGWAAAGRRWVPVATGMGAIVLAAALLSTTIYKVRTEGASTRVAARNFYGILQVRDSGTGADAQRFLYNGKVIHGVQYLDAKRRREPSSYYHSETGIGAAILDGHRSGPRRIGTIGLGAGTTAAYCRPGDFYKYYEINPLVHTVALERFTYLADCRGRVEVVVRDGRLALQEAPGDKLDVLAVDAFTGDAIPMHLLTLEAFAIYLRHIAPDGVIAVHITNRYLDLMPVLRGTGAHFGLELEAFRTEDDPDRGHYPTDWVLMRRAGIASAKVIEEPPAGIDTSNSSVLTWTDDFSTLLPVIRWKELKPDLPSWFTAP